MTDDLFATIEDIIQNDPAKMKYVARKRSNWLKLGLPILEPPPVSPKGWVTPVNEKPERSRAKQAAKDAPLRLKSFTVDLPPSSTIQTASYDVEKQHLIVSFKSGATYDYQHVPIAVIKLWGRARSCGSFFYYNIRTAYPYRKI